MLIHVTWQDITLRLFLSLLTGAVFGFNRGGRGRPAGLRTTTLVCLAACIAMLQASLLMDTTGKASDSFVVLDLMRLPLGILSGIGFIGAGTILKRGDIVHGVTTAGTLWFVTVMGLCFGGGQIGLGLAAFGVGFAVLAGLRKLESRIHQDRHATLTIEVEQKSLVDSEIRAALDAEGFKIKACSAKVFPKEEKAELRYLLNWRCHDNRSHLPLIYETLSRQEKVLKVEWTPEEEIK